MTRRALRGSITERCAFYSWLRCVLFLAVSSIHAEVVAAGYQSVPRSVDVLPVSLPFQISDMERLRPAEREVFSTVDLEAPIIPFDELSKTMIMESADIDAIFSFSFLPQLGYNLSSYHIEVLCSNSAVLQSEDVQLGPPILMQDDRVNFTASIAFERSVGETDLSFVFRKKDNTIYSSVTVHYTICGISFFHFDDVSKTKTFLVGNEYETTVENVALHDGIKAFYAYIQFPDESSQDGSLVGRAGLPNMSSMVTTVDGRGPLAPHNFASCLNNHTRTAGNGKFLLDDLCSFGFTSWDESHDPYFVVRLLKYQTGTIRFHFQWDDFLKGKFAGDIFETSLTIKVNGSSAPSLIAVRNPGPFQKAGGQLLDFVVANFLANATYSLQIGSNSLHPVAMNSSHNGWTIITFVTPAGQGKNILWDLSYSTVGSGEWVSCPWSGREPRFIFNYVDEDILITSLNPSFGPSSGGTIVTCNGYFGNFTMGGGRDNRLMLGSFALGVEYIVSVSREAIVFKVPSRDVIKISSYEIGCYVQIRGIRSNEVSFAYESLRDLSVDFRGGSYEKKNDTHMVPLCESKNSSSLSTVSMFAYVNNGATLQALSYEWRVVVFSSRAEVVKTQGFANAKSFSVLLSALSVREIYEAIVVVSDTRYKTQVTSSVKFQLTEAEVIGVGLSIDHTRSIALPPVDARVSASVTEHGTCFGRNNRLSYNWTYLAVTRTLSARTGNVALNLPSPRRLGREYIIPRRYLKYGKHEIIVKVYYSDDPNIYGTARTWLNVQPADLQPIIGNGESQIQISGSSDLQMTAERSYDPDDASSGSSDGFSYEWECELSSEGGESFLQAVQCPDQLLAARDRDQKSFRIDQEAVKSVHFRNTTFIRYSLVVRKEQEGLEVRSSLQVSQVIKILATEETLASRGSISITSIDGHPLSHNLLPYYDTLVLSPGGSSGTAWRFRILEPVEEAFTFLRNPKNLITLPGFYRSDELIAGRHALGISKGALEPDTTYKFEILFESVDADRTNPVQVSIRTMPKPIVSFLPLSQTAGTTETMFLATASSSVENYAFRYHFYIKMNDGSEMCVDGCSGQQHVSFRIPVAGKYTLKCVMVDARGKYVIEEAKEIHTIEVKWARQHSSLVKAQSEALQESFNSGDHGSFEIENIQLAQYATTAHRSNTSIADSITELVESNVAKLADMFRKTQPNTALAKDYMLIAKSFASIPVGHDVMGGVDTFYGICRMVYYAVQNTPSLERFDMIEELTITLGKLAAHAKQAHSQGTSRMRLLPEEQRLVQSDTGVNEALLELNELALPVIARVVSRSSGCGELAVVNVSNVGAVHVATSCSKEHGLRLAGRHSTMKWCEDVFAEDGQTRLIFVLGEFGDYIKNSGILTLRKSIGRERVEKNGEVELETVNLPSHGFVVTKTMVVKADDNYSDANQDEDSEGESMTGMAVADESIGNGSCFSLQQDVRATAAIFPEYAEVYCRAASTIEYVNTKSFSSELPSHAYSERSLSSRIGGDGVSGNVDGETQSGLRVSSVVRSLHGRTFGAKRGECRDLRPRIFGEGASWWVPLVAVAGTLLTVMLLGLAGIRRESRLRTELWVDSGDAPYIERDAYGRDLGHFDQEVLGVDDEDGEEHVVYESPRLKAKSGGTSAADTEATWPVSGGGVRD